MTADTLLPWLSAGKPLTAVAILQLVERGLLRLDEPVAKWIPEFASGGKDAVTIRHLLTHTAGFREVKTGWPQVTWAETIERCCACPLEADWIVGETAGYHIASSWFVLGELVQIAGGQSFASFLREFVLFPCGCESTWNGMPRDDWQKNRERIGVMSQRDRVTSTVLPWHEAESCAAPSPGANTRGPVRELGFFYESLLSAESPILRQESIHLLTSRQRCGIYDRTLQHVVDFGFGVIVDSNRYGADTVPYGFGRYCSERTFGHGGSQSSMGFADPEHGLVMAYITNGRIGEARHQRRNTALIEAAYRDLGLT